MARLAERRTASDRTEPSGYVFTASDGGPIHPHSISQTLERIARRASLPIIRSSDLRHTNATLSIKDQEPVKVVSERVGPPATPAFTIDTYQHVLPGMQAEAAGQLRGPHRVFYRQCPAEQVVEHDPKTAKGPASSALTSTFGGGQDLILRPSGYETYALAAGGSWKQVFPLVTIGFVLPAVPLCFLVFTAVPVHAKRSGGLGFKLVFDGASDP